MKFFLAPVFFPNACAGKRLSSPIFGGLNVKKLCFVMMLHGMMFAWAGTLHLPFQAVRDTTTGLTLVNPSTETAEAGVISHGKRLLNGAH